jgi:hypothetical protein
MYGTGSTAYNATLNQTVSEGQWYHVVGVYDGANIYLYVNGQLGTTVPAPLPFAPVASPAIPMSIGARADGQLGYFRYNGSVDEVAYYTNALSAADVLAHFQNGTSASPSTAYEQLVLAKKPAAYYRLNEAAYSDPGTRPTAVNAGALAAGADAEYGVGVINGVPGVNFSGFGANNYAAQFNAQAGSISIPAQGLATDTITLTCWLKRRGYQTLGGVVMQREPSTSGTATGLQIWDANNNDLRGNWNDANYSLVTGLVPPDNTWTFAAMVVTPTNTVIYMDDIAVSLAAVNGGDLNHAIHDFSIAPILIGEDSYGGRIFNGEIDEVAVFPGALTADQLKQLFYSGNVPPIVLTQPTSPAGTLMAGAPLTLKAVVSGCPTLVYQWTKDGVPVVGQTASTLAIPNVSTNDAGVYALTISNSFGTATSEPVAITVEFPTEAAKLARAVGIPAYNPDTKTASLTRIHLEFTGALAQSATNLANFSIPGLTVSNAQFTNNNQVVVLTTSPQTQGASYTVTTTGLVDGVGNAVVDPVAQFRAWIASPANGIRFEEFAGIENNSLDYLTNSFNYPDHPTLTTNLWAFDSRIIFPAVSSEDSGVQYYGARMSGVFVPPYSGNWRFYVRSDDLGELFLNPSGADPAGKISVVVVGTCCQDWSGAVSGLYSLVAGQPYYIELLYKEGSGGDYGKVAARLDGTGTPPLGVSNTIIDSGALAGPTSGYPYAPADADSPLAVVGPTNVSAIANSEVTLTATASNPLGYPMQYQWKRNNVEIPGATGSSYTFTAATSTAGQYSVQVSKIGAVVQTTAATLTVTADTSAPTIVAVRGSNDLYKVIVTFSDVMGSAQTPSSYTLTGFNVLSAELDSSGRSVTLTLDKPLTPGQSYNLSVQNVTDAANNVLTSATTAFPSFVFSRGLLQFDYFGGIAGTYIGELESDPRYPDSPDRTAFLSGFNSRLVFPDDSNALYGDRISGVFVPKETGNYLFYLKSDDSSSLYLNPDGMDPAGAQFLAEAVCCNGFATSPSTPQALTGGQFYYIQAVHKEGTGGDYVQAAVKLETDTTEPNGLWPISPSLIGVLADPEGASVTITRQPASVQGVYLGADAPLAILAATFNASNGGFSNSIYGTPKLEFSPWAYDSARGSWSCSGSNSCFGPIGSALISPPITLTKEGGVELTFVHRYSFEGFNASDGTAWDGGQVRYSVNGGPIISIPASSFTANGYQGSIQGSIDTNITASSGWLNAAFLGESTGYASGAYLTSVATLGYFNAGDVIQVEFITSWDDCSEGSIPNWEIDRVELALGAAVPVALSFSVEAESTYKYQPNPYMSYFWQKDTGTGFKDIEGANAPTYDLSAWLSDSGSKLRCIVYGPGASAISEAATVTVTVPLSYLQTATNTLVLSWPSPAPLPDSTFLLEYSADVAAGTWTAVPASQYTSTSTSLYYVAPITSSEKAVFYRLRRN